MGDHSRQLGKQEDGLPFGSGRTNGLRNPDCEYPLVSSGSSSNSMDVSPWESTGWLVLTAVTGGAAGSTGSSDIVSLLNSPLTFTAPVSFIDTGQQPWVP